MGGTSKEESRTGSSSNISGQQFAQSLTPWAGSSGLLSGLLNKLGATPTDLSGAETTALDALAGKAAGGNQYAPAIGGVATELLGGGIDRTPIASGAYDEYRKLLAPTIGGDYLDPSKNPFFSTVTNTIGNDVTNRLNAMYAGAGRDPAGAGSTPYLLSKGITEATAPIFSDIYNTERGRQLDAITGQYGAGNTTTGLLSSLDQTRLGNKQAGIGAAEAALGSEMWGPMQMLAIESQRTGIPMQRLAQQYGLVLPATQAFGTQTGSSTGYNQGQSQSTAKQETPFNAMSLLPLALMPFTGGASLAGMGAGALGSGLFSAFSNGFKPGMYAEGGRPPVGEPALVGERGPELFVPDQPGMVVPNDIIRTMEILARIRREPSVDMIAGRR